MKKIIKIILIVTAIMLFFAEAVSAATIMSVTDDGMSVAVSGDITNGKLTVDRRLFPYTGEDSRPTIEGLYIEQSIAAYIRSQKIEATVRAAVNGDGYTVKYYKREYDAATSTFTETEITEAKEVGDYKMVLTGKGGFRGELVCLFNIYPLPARKVNPKIKSVKDFEKDKSSDKSKVSEKNATKSEAKSEAKYLPVKISKTEDKGKTEKVVSGTKKKERDKDLSDSYEEKSDKLTLMFTGDLMCKKLMQEAAEKNGGYNFKPTFKYAKKVFSEADYVVGNLETLVSVSMPLNREYGRMQGRPFLNAPIEYLEALGYAGYQGLVMANNHCCDGGVVGIKETINAVNKAGFDNVGLYDSENDKHYFMIEEKGYKVAVLSFAVYFNENDELLTRYEQNTYLSKPKYSSIKADIAAAKKAGADYIVSYLHCGEEYSQEISARQKNIPNGWQSSELTI